MVCQRVRAACDSAGQGCRTVAPIGGAPIVEGWQSADVVSYRQRVLRRRWPDAGWPARPGESAMPRALPTPCISGALGLALGVAGYLLWLNLSAPTAVQAAGAVQPAPVLIRVAVYLL